MLTIANVMFCFSTRRVRAASAKTSGSCDMPSASACSRSTSAAAAAASEGVDATATPTSAAANAGASLIPSPTIATRAYAFVVFLSFSFFVAPSRFESARAFSTRRSFSDGVRPAYVSARGSPTASATANADAWLSPVSIKTRIGAPSARHAPARSAAVAAAAFGCTASAKRNTRVRFSEDHAVEDEAASALMKLHEAPFRSRAGPGRNHERGCDVAVARAELGERSHRARRAEVVAGDLGRPRGVSEARAPRRAERARLRAVHRHHQTLHPRAVHHLELCDGHRGKRAAGVGGARRRREHGARDGVRRAALEVRRDGERRGRRSGRCGHRGHRFRNRGGRPARVPTTRPPRPSAYVSAPTSAAVFSAPTRSTDAHAICPVVIVPVLSSATTPHSASASSVSPPRTSTPRRAHGAHRGDVHQRRHEQRARRRRGEKRERAVHRARFAHERYAEHDRTEHHRGECDSQYGFAVPIAERIEQPRNRRSAVLRRFGQTRDARRRRVLGVARRPHDERAVAVHGARGNLIPDALRDGERLAGDVLDGDERAAVRHDAVQRHLSRRDVFDVSRGETKGNESKIKSSFAGRVEAPNRIQKRFAFASGGPTPPMGKRLS
jgi:hypothetical protein